MKERSSIEPPAALAEIPMLAEYEDELAEPAAQPVVGMTAHERPFGIYSSNELRSSRAQWPTDDLDWAQVVDTTPTCLRDDHRRDREARRAERWSAR